ncbi:MAG: sulfatase [Verrucomicrobiota bacterium]
MRTQSQSNLRTGGILKCFVAICLGLAALPVTAAKSSPPNILVVLSDDHSKPHVGCYNNPDINTPNLDRFAAQGMRFDRAYVASPQCVPSRAAILTGRSPVRIQMTRFSAPLPLDVRTFPEWLRECGYFTGVAGRNYHLDGSAKMPPETAEVLERHGLRTFQQRFDFVNKDNDPKVLAVFKKFLDQVPHGKPFFLQLCFKDPHRPLDTNAIPQPHNPAKLTLPEHYPDTAKVRADFANYYDEIARLDGYFGEVLATLEARGLASNTIVVFMGDNGASQLRGKGTLYEFGVNVPLVIRWPGKIKPGSATSELISGEDLAPTLLAAAGIAAPREMTGKSFLKLLTGEAFTGRKHAFSERGSHSSGLPTHSAAFDLGRCVVTARHKLIYNALWQLPYTPVDFSSQPFWKELRKLNDEEKLSAKLSRIYFSPTRPMFELYDLEKDPAEMENLADRAEVAAVEKELKAALQEWMILERDFVPLPVPPAKDEE